MSWSALPAVQTDTKYDKKPAEMLLRLTRKVLTVSALNVISLCLTIGLIELSLRIIGIPSQPLSWRWAYDHHLHRVDKDLLYAQVPNQDFADDMAYSTNELGLKTKLGSSVNSQAEWQIVALGDSFVWGNTTYDETYPTQLEKILREQGYSVAVHNAGTSGYGLDQEFIQFRERLLPALKPNLLIWHLSLNDLRDNRDRPLLRVGSNQTLTQLSARRYGLYWAGVVSAFVPEWILTHSRLANLTVTKLETIRLLANSDQTEEELFFNKVSALRKEVKALASAHNFKVIFVLNPNQNVITPQRLETARAQAHWRQRIIETFSNEVFIDENAVFTQALQHQHQPLFLIEPQWPYDYQHPNASGNELMAHSVSIEINKVVSRTSLENAELIKLPASLWETIPASSDRK